MEACHSGGGKSSISSDSTVIAQGKTLFTQHCGTCHNFAKRSIGPALGGITTRMTPEWIGHFIQDPAGVIGAGDAHAKQLYQEYKNMMPSFGQLSAEQIGSLIAYLHTHKTVAAASSGSYGPPVKDPVPGSIPSSGLTVDVGLVAEFPRSVDSGRTPLARITKMDVEPRTGKLFVVDLRGKLFRLQDGKPVLYMDMARLRPNFIHEPGLGTGFGSFAFHPGFATNGLLYTSHTERAGSGKADFVFDDSIKTALQWVVMEWTVKDPKAPSFSGEGRELFRLNMVESMHGMQEIAFNPYAHRGDKDYGILYIGVGDGGCVEAGYPALAHNLHTIWGTILRIDPSGRNSRNGRYGIPGDNPFARRRDPIDRSNDPSALDSSARPEIYAYGFRNPHRMSWTPSGEMIAVNVGQANIEAVYRVLPGHDYGWPIREGNFLQDPHSDLGSVYTLPADDSSYHISYPIAEYDHDEGKAICGGFLYTGKAISALRGKYLFGDIMTGRLMFFDWGDVAKGKMAPVKEWAISMNGRRVTLLELCGGKRADLHFGKDKDGEIYILTKTDGKVYRLVGMVKQ